MTTVEAVSTDALRRDAVRTLIGNWRGGSTVPTASLYPHQWSWDSAFNAIGWAHIAPRRAWAELSGLLGAQWADGRVPQIVFDPAVPEDAYFPGPWYWRPMPPSGPPPGVRTSGIVQPPMHAGAALAVAGHDASALARLYPRLVRWHDYLWERRLVAPYGLIAIVHPWESGLDNSPAWDAPLQAVPAVDVEVIAGHRRDLRHSRSAHRPSNDDYARYALLVREYRDGGYRDDLSGLRFCVLDPLMNSVYAWSSLALAEIATRLGLDPAPHRVRAARLTESIEEHLWSPALRSFAALDVHTGALQPVRTVGGLTPLLLPDLSTGHTEALLSTLTGPAFRLGAGSKG